MEKINLDMAKGLLPTPPLPQQAHQVELTENARQVLIRRYVRRGETGKPAESIEEMFWRVAFHVARVEENWNGDFLDRAQAFYDLLTSKRFFPNSPTFTGAGTPLGQLAACFVLPITDDMGRASSGIFQTLRNAALIQQTGGGNGFSFSRLRPKGCLVKSSAGQATGPVGFLRVYDNAFGEIAQGGSRRGANMGVLRVDHPDVEEFITGKTDENAITNFNISVGITDAFMQAVEDDGEWDLIFPDIASPDYRKFSGTIEQAREAGVPLRVYKTVRARDLFEKIVRQAHHNGEPGVLFLDAGNAYADTAANIKILRSKKGCSKTPITMIGGIGFFGYILIAIGAPTAGVVIMDFYIRLPDEVPNSRLAKIQRANPVTMMLPIASTATPDAYSLIPLS